MGNKKNSLISIGMPVYNEQRYIQQSLNSLLSQKYRNFELIISDNASTDCTVEICRECAMKDDRIKFYQNETNLGATANFKRVLDFAKGKYFMWAGGHDLWAPNFISRCIDILGSDSEVVLAYPRAMRIDHQGTSLGLAANQIDTRDMALFERFSHLIWKISGGDLIYGVIRTQVLKQIELKGIWGGDQAILAKLSLKGSFAHISETLFYWRKVRDESMELRKKTVPLMLDTGDGYRNLTMELPELWRELGDECLAAIDRASVPHNDKMILKSETKRCFTERYNVRWPASIPKDDSRYSEITVARNILLTTSAAPDQSPFSTTEKRPPIGIGFLISVLKNAGHNIFFIDNYLQPSDFLNTDYLPQNHINYVGIYANTICYRDTLRMLYKLEWLRQTGRWKGKIIVGGPHTTVCLDTIPDFVDYVVQGEGEQAILDIVDGRVTERVVKYPRIKNLDELPMPAWDFFVNLPYNWSGEWFQEKPVFTMNTSRGCPFRCKFCSVGSIWGKEYTYFSADRIVSDIEYLTEHHGAKGIYFREDNFTLNKKRLTTFCNLLIKKGIKIPWACETRVDTLDKETVELMSRAGACGFYLGVESGSQRILDFLNKDITVDKTRNAFKLCHEFGIKTAASLVVGVPTETKKDLTITLELLKEIKPTITWYNVFVGIPDSELYQHTINNNLYEFIDDRGLLYLKGHNDRVRKFYGRAWDAEVPIKQYQNGSNSPEISVVMSVYNGERHLKKAIESVLQQTHQNFEFIIVNDGSNDKTKEILECFNDPRIIVINNSNNLGLTRSLNRGIKSAKGKYISRMDADDISLPHRFETQLEFLKKNPDYALVGSSYYKIHENGKIISLVQVLTNDSEIRHGLRKNNWFGHGTVMMRKDIVLEIGGYDEKFMYAQDYDLWLRIAEDHKIANLEEPLYCWRYSSSGISKEKKSEQRHYAGLAVSEATKRERIRQREKGGTISLTEPMVSVIVPTYNRPDMLIEAIKSILNQTYQDFEIAVINDAGDNVENIVTSLNQKGNITYIKHSKNRGLAAARNAGIKVARGKYIAYLDDDDIFYPDHIETLVNFLEGSEYKVAYADANRALQAPKGNIYQIVRRDLLYSIEFSRDLLLVQNISPVQCFMHERSCVHQVGFFDETLTTHEDWDMWIRLSRKFDFKHIKRVTSEFRSRQDGSNMTSSRLPDFLTTMQVIFERYKKLTNGNPQLIEIQQKRLRSLENEICLSKDNISCSIIIITYNSLEDIQKCVDSISRNTSFPYEIIVIDNASSDGTQEYLKTLKNAKTILNSTNNGFSKGCNQGIQIAKGDYVVLLNPDTMVTEDWDVHLISHFKEGVGAVGPVSNYVAGLQKIELYSKENLSGQININSLQNKLYQQNKGKSVETKLLIGFCIMLKREVIEKVGMVDEDLFLGNDDLDMSLRLRNNDYRLLVAADTFIYHKGQASFKSEPSEKTKALVQESTDVLYKKLQKQYGPDKVPSPQELWGIDWFKPSKDISEENKLTSIVILAHNQLEYTKKCIESIFEYTKNRFELIVVDNGSTDGTVQYLENLKCRYGANCTDHQIEASKPKGRKKKKGKKKKGKKIVALDKSCKDVKVIRNKENLGFAAGNNQAMAAVKGDYILLMNNDIVVTPGWLERMISCAERNPKIGIVGPMSNYVIGPQLVKEVNYNTASLARLNKYAKKFAENNTDQARLILRVVGFCMLIKRAVIDKIGGMDDRYGLGNFEDDDFSLRATLAGFESWIAEDCFVHHFGSRTFIGAKIDYNESLRKNWEIFKEKWKLPRELSCGSPYTISHIPKDCFDPAKHYCPLSRNDILPEKPDIISGSPGEIYGGIQPILASGQHEKAIITLEKLLESYPDFALAHNDLGVLYFNKREKEKALNHYEKAAQLEPNNITFQKNLSDFYYVELGRLEEALQGYVHVLSINPKDVETLLIVGHICVALHKFDDAQVFYSRVLEIEPENVDARQNLDKLVSGQLPVVSGQPEQNSVALKPASFLTNRQNNQKDETVRVSKNENIESHQETFKNIHTSIIIPILNQQKLINKCVKSIQEYTSETYEIIFVNKGAKGSTLKWLRSVVKENENYLLVELEKGDNFARCYNKGIEASSGEYIVLLHGDVVVTEGWISGMLECINNAPDAGIVGPMTNNASGVQKVSDSDDISLDHLEEFAKSFRQRNRYCRVPSRELSEFCLLFRRELVGKIGPFDESLGQSNREVDDICLRAALEGYRNIIVGDVFVYNYNGPELIGNKKSFTEKWNGIDAQNPLGKKLIALNAIEKAVELDEKGQIDDAVKILAQGIGHVPDDKRLYHALAEMLINNKQFKDALDTLNELPPDDQDGKKLELTAYCMEGMEQYKEAEEYADRTLLLNADSALALNIKGIFAYRQGVNRTAESLFNRAIASDPGFGEPYTNLGALKWAMGDQEEALDLYERGFILSSTIMDITTIYHSAVTELGEFERAEPVFRDASALHPHNRRLKYLLIDILIQQDKHDLAVKEIEDTMLAFGIDDGILSAALKVREILGPKEIDKISNKNDAVSLCMIVKNEEEHLAKCLRSLKPVVDEMIVVDTGSTDRTKDIARVFGARVFDFKWTDDFSEARNFSISKASGKWILVMDADEVISPLDYGALIKLVKKSTSRSVAYSFVTKNYSTRANTIGWTVNDGKYGTEEAGSGWMPSTKVRLFHNVSHIQFEYPVHEKVEPSLKNGGIDIKKCNVPVHHYGQLNKEKSDINTKGEAYYHMGRKKLNEMGDDLVAIRELAVQAGDLGKHDEAIELWQRLVAIKPDMPVAYVNMVTAYLKLGKYEDALLSARKAVELAPHMKEALNNYALCQFYLGNARQAIPVLEKLMEQEPEYLSAQFVLSAAYCCDGKMKMGLETFEKLRQTFTRPGLAVACHDLAKKLVSAQRLEYAISLLEAAIEGKYVNKDVLSLLSECRRTEQEAMDCIHSSSALSVESRTQPACSSR